jgi:hypothetical protein
MKRVLVAVAIAAAAVVQVSSAGGASSKSIELKVGDAIDVVGTKVACFAITSNAKDGIGCVLWKQQKPMPGTFGAGLAVDGSATLTKLNPDGSGTTVMTRHPQARRKVYQARVGDVFGWQISSTTSLGCRVLNVTSAAVAPVYRGIKVSCWRATSTSPLPNTYGVSISDSMAGIFRFDAKGNVSTWGVIRRQPARP